MGQLIPIGMQEVLPSDTIQHSTNLLIRVSPQAAPVMHPVTARVHHFFVPTRKLVKDTDSFDWEDFITGGNDGMNADEIPTIMSTGTPKDLLDYLGIPRISGIPVNIFPVRAFNNAYNEYYRDQDTVPIRDLDDLTIPLCAWEKDYFTTCRPFSQRGPDVTIPLGDNAPVKGIGKLDATFPQSPQADMRETGGTIRDYTGSSVMQGGASNSFYTEEDPTNPGFPAIYADLLNATGADINDVRKAFAIQRYQEARAKYGSRYVEYLKYCGVTKNLDARLQRPEYLSGGHAQIQFSEVLQTAPEDDTGNPTDTKFGVGDMYGHGIAAMKSNKYRRTIEEHGFIISMLSVRPKAIYTQGIHRTWLRKHKEDFFQKELQQIGQQEVFNNEVYADETDGMETFGFQDRYSEYKHAPSRVSSEFRDILNYWHMGREFATPPVLNQSFTDCSPTKRIYNEQESDSLWSMVQHKLVARRQVMKSASSRVL